MTDDFTTKLARYKQLIDTDIARYAAKLEVDTEQQFGSRAVEPLRAYTAVLARGGKRLRGVLTMVGYEMSGGTDRSVALQAARVIEMLHAYLLVIDDIQDRSAIRRDGPTAHKYLEHYHRQHKLHGDASHFGVATAIDGALVGLHEAEMILSELSVPASRRLAVLQLVNETLRTTIHGQSQDIFNEVVSEASMADVEHVLEWKTANYSVLNPLQVGMMLADAPQDTIETIADFALPLGKAFQIVDDIIGTFGEQKDIHKNPMDDVREGKRTLLVVHALAHASKEERVALLAALGNDQLTQTAFLDYKAALESSGALAYARETAEKYTQEALRAFDAHVALWDEQHLAFLRALTDALLYRNA